MRTLSELNETKRTMESDGLTLQGERAVGRVGQYRTGQKLHLLYVLRVIGRDEAKVSPYCRYNIGDVFSAGAPCNSNGQHVGQVIKGLDTNAITCQKCRG